MHAELRASDVAGAERAIAILKSNGRERDAAVWKTCAEIARTLDLFTPQRELIYPLGWGPDQSKALYGLSQKSLADLPLAVKSMGKMFGEYRNCVLDLEGDNARKLQTVIWASEQPMKFAKHEGADEDRLEALTITLGVHLDDVWKVKASNIKDYRSFALKHCRRFDLLPREWREL